MHDFGTTSEQLAEVAVAARRWALLNPKAFHHDSGPLTVDAVLASPMVSSPLHTLDCCLVTDGGGAVVLTTLERARDLRRPPIVLLGYGEATTNQGMSQIPDLTSTGAVAAARRAFAMAALRPADIDVVQLYDSFTITVLLTLEALGFCARGESGPFVEHGRLGPGGDFPINTSGGGLSYCHPGMFGIFLVIEAARQLRGEAGPRQLPRARTAVCHGTGGILSTHATVILGRA
jgi:acetyl-CoA acetyltransferase